MKLFQTYDSPFPTRVRLLLYAKGIEVEIIEPGFHASTEAKGEYLNVNPIGRVPTLVLDDGRALPESEVICEYLEDAYPEPSLRPADPWARARMRLLSRICDFYVVMAMVPHFNLSGRSRRHWEPAVVEAASCKVAEALGYLEEYIGEQGYAVGRSLTQADGAIALLNAMWVDPKVGGVGSFISLTGSYAILAATVLAVAALLPARRIHWLPALLLVAFGYQLQESHAAPHGPIAFALLIVAAFVMAW